MDTFRPERLLLDKNGNLHEKHKSTFCVFLSCSLQIWGDDVEAFRPERWLDENGELRSVPEFIPFGLGMMHLLLYTKTSSF